MWRVLVVEDDYFIANDLAAGFRAAGMDIVGPIPSLARALEEVGRARIDGAVLDINLDGDKVYAVADALIGRGIPVLLVTGYEQENLPARYRDIPLCLKPVDSGQVVQVLRRLVLSQKLRDAGDL